MEFRRRCLELFPPQLQHMWGAPGVAGGAKVERYRAAWLKFGAVQLQILRASLGRRVASTSLGFGKSVSEGGRRAMIIQRD
jgi:hypothetical protein